MNKKLAFVLVCALLLIFIILQNATIISVRFLFWEISMSQVILLLVVTGLGFAGGYITATIVGYRRKKQPIRGNLPEQHPQDKTK